MSPGDEFDIDVTHANGRVIVAVAGEVDLETAPVLQTTLEGIDATSHIVLDCAALEFMDSTGLAVVLRQSARTSEAGGSVLVRRPSAPVLRLLESCRLDHLIEGGSASGEVV